MASFDSTAAAEQISLAADRANSVLKALYGSDAEDALVCYVPITASFNGSVAELVATSGGFPIAWNGIPVDCDTSIAAFMVRGVKSQPSRDTSYAPMPLVTGMAIAEMVSPSMNAPVTTSGTFFSGTSRNDDGLPKSVQLRVQTWATKEIFVNGKTIAEIGDPIDISGHFHDVASIANLAALPVEGMIGWSMVVCASYKPWMNGASETLFGMKAAVKDKSLERLNLNIVTGRHVDNHMVFDTIGCVIFLLPPNNFAAQRHLDILSKNSIDVAANGGEAISVDKITLKGTKVAENVAPKFAARRRASKGEES